MSWLLSLTLRFPHKLLIDLCGGIVSELQLDRCAVFGIEISLQSDAANLQRSVCLTFRRSDRF